jgi:hypothetical protein
MSRNNSKGKATRPAKESSAGWLDRLKHLWLRVQRKGAGADPALDGSARRNTPADSPEAVLLRAALKGVLDQHASSRSVLVHLTVLETALGRHGLRALDELPHDVLRRAMSQLETLVSDWSPGNLAALRARLTAALIKHRRANDRRRTSERLADFQDSRQLQVKDVSVSTFMEANARWQHSLTGHKL